MPLIKIRNIPYTAVAHANGFSNPGDQTSDNYRITPARWTYKEPEKVRTVANANHF